MYKILSSILLSRLTPYTENIWGISVWIKTQQANYWSYILHTWDKMGIQLNSASAAHRLQEAYDAVTRELLRNMVIECGIRVKLVRLIKVCLSQTYSWLRVGKNLCNMIPIKNGMKQGDPFSPLLFIFAFEYVIRRVQVIQDDSKFNGTHQLLVYADDVNILDGSVHTIRKNAVASIVVSKETGLEVNEDQTEYTVISWDRDAGRSHSIKTDSSSFEMMDEFRYLGTTWTNQDPIQEDIKSRLKWGNACHLSMQNLLSFSLLSRIIKIKLYRTIILLVVLYGCETWSLTFRGNVGWGCWRVGCSREYFGLRGTR